MEVKLMQDKILDSLLVDEMRTKSNSSYEEIFEQSEIGLITVLKDGTIVESNRVIFEMFGWQTNKIHDRNIRKYLNFNELKKLEIEGRLRVEKKVLNRDAQKIWISVSIDKIKSILNDTFHYAVLISDISQRKNMEFTLQNEIKELKTLIYKSSHDLKAPLASNTGLVSVAKMEVKDPIALSYLDKIEISNARLKNTISDIFTVSKMLKNNVDHGEINLKSIIETILSEINFIPGFNTIKFDLKLNYSKPLKGNTRSIRSIIQNVIANAVKYQDKTKEIQKILIEISENDDDVIIKIEDNGVGILESELPNIFNMFHRSDMRTEGTGLGLFIVREALHKMGGSVSVKSKYEQGSAFEIKLPINRIAKQY